MSGFDCDVHGSIAIVIRHTWSGAWHDGGSFAQIHGRLVNSSISEQ
jgi:hypothetical protein